MIDQDIFNKGIQFIGAKGLIFIGDKIITCKRDEKAPNFPLQEDLPGGGPEVGETPFETLEREVKEELGLDINKEDVQFAKKYPSLFDEDKFMYFIVVKSNDLKENDIHFGDEGISYSLMSPQEFVGLKDGVKKHQEKVADYLSSI